MELKPFEHIDNSQHESFEDASSDTLSTKLFQCLHGDKIYNSFVCGNTT